MPEYFDVPADTLERVRACCAALPEVHEEPAWTGTRWRVRSRTFAHVIAVSGRTGPGGVAMPGEGEHVFVAFRSAGDELDALRHSGLPFLTLGWGREVVGLLLDDGTDWDEVAELVTESYCLLAPQKLVARVARPG